MIVAQSLARSALSCLVGALTGAACLTSPIFAADSDIRIGQTMPYSGPASAYGVVGKVQSAYIDMINSKGGVNGRKIRLISLDDGYSPPKAAEQVRKLVEQDNVHAVFGSVGTPGNMAVHKYLNSKKTPQIFLLSGAAIWNEFDKYPWTIGWQPDYASEGQIYAKYILKETPDAKIAILYQNDDSGRDYLKGFKQGLGDARAKKMIVAEASYHVSDPTVDSQVVKLQASGADVLFTHATPKFGAQAIRKVAELGWKPLHIISNTTNSVKGALAPAGLDKAQGLVSSFYIKDPSDPVWHNDADYKEYAAFLAKYAPGVDPGEVLATYGYLTAQGLIRALEQCKDDVSRENIMRQARNLNFTPGMILPGIRVETSPSIGVPIRSMQLGRFEGKNWKMFGDVITAAE